MTFHLLAVGSVVVLAWAAAAWTSHGQELAGTSPLPPLSAIGQARLPPGFKLSLFAAEPEVVQPVSMTFDDLGRLWVVEMLTYADLKTNFDLGVYDRIVILQDKNGDGRADARTVFWEGGQRVTSVAVGFGGVWILAAPRMLFIPDRNRDDIPDGPPEVLLDGWNAGPVRHNIVNGLKWGPDGWLYGRHGIQATSSVGPPGTPEDERIRLNCCIWRYHPTRHRFEVVCQGGTNSWGHDWDDLGNLWFINTVIGHLWHGIPGAWYRRMYGDHLSPNRYGLIDQHADHYHWDTGKSWTASRDAAQGADPLGGGHAHSGLMVYLGDNWPAQYRDELFTLNFHGRRINHEHLESRGSGYVGRHRPDLVHFADPWFRGIDLACGPDGGVFVLDWSDRGECHENDADGVHRETGRIFKLTYGTPRPLEVGDVSALTDAELVRLQLHSNEWFVRQARRVLQERAADGRDLNGAHAALTRLFREQNEPARKLRALWALHVTGGAPESWLWQRLGDAAAPVRAWTVTLLAEDAPSASTLARFQALAEADPSPQVRLALASALQRLQLHERAPLARALLSHSSDAGDHNLPLMIWYGIEPAVSAGIQPAVELYASARMPLVRQFIARRLAENWDPPTAEVEGLLTWAIGQQDPSPQLDVLRGLGQGLKGRRKAIPPAAWKEFSSKIARAGDSAAQDLLRELNRLFGDGQALTELKQIAFDPGADSDARCRAVDQLVEGRADDLDALLEKLMTDQAVAGAAARGLALSPDPEARAVVFRHFEKLSPAAQATVVGHLVTRAASARELLNAMGEGIVPRRLINSLHARQILGHDEPGLARQLHQVWGEVRAADEDRKRLMARYRALLTPERLRRADPGQGRGLFERICAVCHRLHGEGQAIGPDLTGAGRSDPDYLLENLVDPSAMVAADYQMSNVELKDGRFLSGVVVARSNRTIDLQTVTERLTLDRADIAEIRAGTLSLMPDGLLEALEEQEILDLIGYLMQPGPPEKQRR